MASIQPGKIKLSNYKYELNDNGQIIEKSDGTQPYSAKVIDSIDFDWRPFTVNFSSPDGEPESFGDNRISAISGQEGKYAYSLNYTEDLIWLLNRSLTYSVLQAEESEFSDYSSLAYYANLGYYASLAYYANHAYYSSLSYYGNSAYTLEEIRYRNSGLTDGQKYSVSYVDKSTTENGTSYVTICYTDLSSTANTGTEKTAVTLTNTTKYKVVDGIAQDSQGRMSYTYLEINTTHTNTKQGLTQGQIVNNVFIDANGNFSYTTYDPSVNSGTAGTAKTLTNSVTHNLVDGITQDSTGKISYHYIEINTTHTNTKQGSTQGQVVNNVYLDANGNFSYTTFDPTVTAGTANDAPGSNSTGGKTIPGIISSAYNVLTGITQDSKGQITYTYTPLYMIPSHFTYHVMSLNTTDVPNTNNPTANTVCVLNGIALSNNNENKENHGITYHTISVPTKKYVDSLLKANDAMRYCGTFTKGTGDTIVLHPNVTDTTIDEETGLPINENYDTSRGAVYKYSDNANPRVTINGNEIENGDTIYSYLDDASSTTLVGWNVIQQNINITNLTGVESTNSEQGNRIITNIHITNGGELSYNYTDGTLNGDYEFTDDITIDGNLLVNGLTELVDNVTIDSDSYTCNTAYFDTNKSYINKNALYVAPSTYIDSSLSVNHNIDLGNNLVVYNNSTLYGDTYTYHATYITTNKHSYFNDAVTYTDRPTQIKNTLVIKDNAVFQSDTYTYHTTYNNSSYINVIVNYIDTKTYIDNALSVKDNLNIGGDSYTGHAAYFGSTNNSYINRTDAFIEVSTYINDNLALSGDSYIGHTAYFETCGYINHGANYLLAPTYMNQSLTVNNDLVVGSDTYTKHTAYFGSGNNSYITATDNYIAPKTYINNSLTVKDNLTVGGDLVLDDITANGNLSVGSSAYLTAAYFGANNGTNANSYINKKANYIDVPTYIRQGLTVSKDTVLGRDLSVVGNIALGNSNGGSSIDMYGVTTFKAATYYGFNGSSYTTNEVNYIEGLETYITQSLTVKKDTVLGDNLTVSGNATFNSDSYTNNTAYFDGSTELSYINKSNMYIDTPTHITKGLTAAATNLQSLIVKDNTILGDNNTDTTTIYGTTYLTANKYSYFNNAVTYTDRPTQIKNTLVVKNNTVLQSDSYTYHTAYNNSSYINAIANYITPATYINNSLTVKDDLTVGGDLVLDDITANGNLHVKGNEIVEGDSYTYHTTYFNGGSYINNTEFYINTKTDINSTLNVDGQSWFNSQTDFNGTVNIGNTEYPVHFNVAGPAQIYNNFGATYYGNWDSNHGFTTYITSQVQYIDLEAYINNSLHVKDDIQAWTLDAIDAIWVRGRNNPNVISYLDQVATYTSKPTQIGNSLVVKNNAIFQADTYTYNATYITSDRHSYLNESVTYTDRPTQIKNTLVTKNNAVFQSDTYTYHTTYNNSSYINATANYIAPKTYINNSLTVKNDLTVGGDLVLDDITANGNLSVGSSAYLTAAYFGANSGTNANSYINKTADYIAVPTYIENSLSVKNYTNIGGKLYALDDLSVAGDTQLGDESTNITTINGTAYFDNNLAYINGTAMYINLPTYLNKNTSMSADLDIGGRLAVTDAVNIDGLLTATGDIALTGFQVDAATQVINIDGSFTYISGNIVLSGPPQTTVIEFAANSVEFEGLDKLWGSLTSL